MCGQYTLELQSPEIQHLCKKDKRLARVISAIGPLTYSLHQDAYSFLIREIIEQRMSVKAASVIYGRLVQMNHSLTSPPVLPIWIRAMLYVLAGMHAPKCWGLQNMMRTL